MRILVDTGVLLRMFDRTSVQHQSILSAFRVLRSNGHELVTTAQNIAELWNVSTRPALARGGLGLSIPMVERRVRCVERLCAVLPFEDPAYQEWRRIVVAESIVGVAVHDARLVATMIAVGITHMLTLNEADFRRYGGIVVLSPGTASQTTSPNPGP
jgi:predicted nucleic acid-binding protein